jgi:hypothetical protein
MNARTSTGLKQPAVGLLGLAIVTAAFWLLGMASGLEHSLLVLGPITTFALPVLAMMALWWGGWPGATMGRLTGGAVNTLLLAAAALVLTFVGQAVVGHASLEQTFGGAAPTAASVPTFPFTMPLAAAVFVVFLQLTFVNHNWPFDKLSARAGGVAALSTSWAVGLALYLLLTNWTAVVSTIPPEAVQAMGLRTPSGSLDALQFIALLLCIVMLQMVFFFVLEGYPFTKIKSRSAYLVTANAFTIIGGWLLWLVWSEALGGADQAVPTISAIAGVTVAGTLISALLFEAWPARLSGTRTPSLLVITSGVLAAVLYVVLMAIGDTATWTKAPVDLWVSIAGLNFIGAVVILHAVLWRRSPIHLAAPTAGLEGVPSSTDVEQGAGEPVSPR